jgi:hypothetical protein
MRKAPKIGQRVRYRSVIGKGQPWEEVRICTGTVTKIYPHYDDMFDDDDNFMRRGVLSPEREWSAAVKVDSRPKWWGYPDTDQFAPDVASLTAIK